MADNPLKLIRERKKEKRKKSITLSFLIRCGSQGSRIKRK